MSKKHVEEYYNQITNDYMEMVNTLKELEELAADKVISPDKIDETKRVVEALKNNYERISWIIFLLNKPNRKSKENGYLNRNKKYLKSISNIESEHSENKRVIKDLNNLWKNEINSDKDS